VDSVFAQKKTKLSFSLQKNFKRILLVKGMLAALLPVGFSYCAVGAYG